jgi:threonine dehydrogenase-like Zn-dependent dehydrogenase
LTAAARWLVRLEAPLDLAGPSVAALGGELALAYALYARVGVGPREPTLILGSGVVARAVAAILAAKGAPVSADMSEHDVRRPRKVIVTDAARLPEALAVAGPRATVAVLTAPGFGSGGVNVEMRAAMAQEITVTGVAGCHPDLVPELVALAVRGDLDVAGLTEIVTLEELAEALTRRGDQTTDTTLVVRMPSP